MTATTRTPAAGPSDQRLYLTLLVLSQGPTGVIEREADPPRLWACFPAERTRYPLELAVIDELARLEWVSLDEAHDGVTVTSRGAYRATRFLKLNGG